MRKVFIVFILFFITVSACADDLPLRFVQHHGALPASDIFAKTSQSVVYVSTNMEKDLDKSKTPSFFPISCEEIEKNIAPLSFVNFNRAKTIGIITSSFNQNEIKKFQDLIHRIDQRAAIIIFGSSLIIDVTSWSEEATAHIVKLADESNSQFLIHDLEENRLVVMDIRCEIKGKSQLNEVYVDLRNYFSAPYYFYLIPPWHPSSTLIKMITEDAKKARVTYWHLKQLELSLMNFPEMQSSLDKQSRLILEKDFQEFFIEQHKFLELRNKFVDGKLLKLDQDKRYSPEVLSLYSRWHKEMQGPGDLQKIYNSEKLDAWGIEMGRIMGQLPLQDGNSTNETASLLSEKIELFENGFDIDYISFDSGIFHLVEYLCKTGFESRYRFVELE